ncbi:MAG: ABC transporter ATP-binding protein [Spirochaetota bacterium]
MSFIELEDITFSYDHQPGLAGFSASIRKGASVAVIGPNGSGKSTLLKLLNGLILSKNGVYRFDREVINNAFLKNSARAKRFHQRVGFVFQNSDAQLFSPTVFEEIAFGPWQMDIPDDEVNKRVFDCLQLLGIEHLKHREPHHLSEGEKKKVAIAAVLALNPEVLVLDEPMEGLDPRTKASLRNVLLSLHEAGKTIIGATHEFDYVKGVFDSVIVLSNEHAVVSRGRFERVVRDKKFLRRHNII